MTISYPLRPPQPNRFKPVASPGEPGNAPPDRKDVEREAGGMPKAVANAMVGSHLEGSE